MVVPSGDAVYIDGRPSPPDGGIGKIMLPAGKVPFELLYSKYISWRKSALALKISGPGVREFLLSDANTGVNDVVDPILVHANVNTTLRSL
jgi:hypothetical protein